MSLWWRDWAQAWTQFDPIDRTVRTPSSRVQRFLRDTPDSELWEAVSPEPAPTWADGVDREAFTAWRGSLPNEHHMPLDQHPERVCVSELVPAWRAGLTTIVEMPYRGHYAHRLNAATLVVSAESRRNPLRYRDALRHWTR